MFSALTFWHMRVSQQCRSCQVQQFMMALSSNLTRPPHEQAIVCRFTLAQRVGCFCLKAAQYGTVGFVMGCAGSALVHGMTALRIRLDAAFEPPPTEQPIAGTGLGWLYFMGLNSNIRYNAINAAEDIMYSRCVCPALP